MEVFKSILKHCLIVIVLVLKMQNVNAPVSGAIRAQDLKLAKDTTISVFALFEPELLESKMNNRVKMILNIHF